MTTAMVFVLLSFVFLAGLIAGVFFHGGYNLEIRYVFPTGFIIRLTRHGVPVLPTTDEPMFELPEIFQNAFARISGPQQRERQYAAEDETQRKAMREAAEDGDILKFHDCLPAPEAGRHR